MLILLSYRVLPSRVRVPYNIRLFVCRLHLMFGVSLCVLATRKFIFVMKCACNVLCLQYASQLWVRLLVVLFCLFGLTISSSFRDYRYLLGCVSFDACGEQIRKRHPLVEQLRDASLAWVHEIDSEVDEKVQTFTSNSFELTELVRRCPAIRAS